MDSRIYLKSKCDHVIIRLEWKVDWNDHKWWETEMNIKHCDTNLKITSSIIILLRASVLQEKILK